MFSNTIFLSLILCFVVQILAWLFQMKTKNADVVDISWSGLIVICSVIYWWNSPFNSLAQCIILFFPALWYLRLSVHLYRRFDVNHEDSRYAYLRKHWKTNTQLKFFFFFCVQAVLAFIFSLPSYWLSQIESIQWVQFILVFIIGFVAIIGVTTADNQLFEFKQNPINQGEVCDSGLWKYSRHPNYFFEWIHWLVYPIALYQSEYFIYSLSLTLAMLLFLLYFTGIPFSEQQSLIHRGDKYRDYQNRTNKFFLWKPKTH